MTSPLPTRCLRTLLATAALGLLASTSLAGPFPERSVKVIIPFPPGAAADTAMRVVARKLSETWHQPVVVENRPGVPGIQAAALARPDGYTLLLGAGSSMVTGPLIAGKLPYDPVKDFAPVSRVVVNVPVMMVHPSLGARSVKDLVALAKTKPGAIDYSSPGGTGSPSYLAMEMFQGITGTKLVQIPYKGGATAVNDLLAGHVRLGFYALPSVTQHIRSGELLALAVASDKRSPALPQVPTMAEAGVSGFKYDIWYALFAPAATPADVVAATSTAVQQALADPEVKRQILEQGAEPSPTSSAELARFMAEDRQRWAALIKDRKIRIEQ